MRTFLIPLALSTVLAMAGTAVAEHTLVIDSGGNYYYSGDSGEAVLIDKIIRLPGAPDAPNPPPNDNDDNDNDGGSLSNVAKEVAKLTEAQDDPEVAAVLADIYQEVGKSLKGRTPNLGEVDVVLTTSLEAALSLVEQKSPGAREKWAPFRQEIATLLTAEALKGGGSLTGDQYAAFFNDVHKGMSSTFDENALPEWVREIILQIIPVIIALVTRLLGGIG